MLKNKVFKAYDQKSLKNHHTQLTLSLGSSQYMQGYGSPRKPCSNNPHVNIRSILLSPLWLMKHLRTLMKTLCKKEHVLLYLISMHHVSFMSLAAPI